MKEREKNQKEWEKGREEKGGKEIKKKNKEELQELSQYSYNEKLHQDMIDKEQTLKPKYDEYKKLQTLIQRVPIVQKELDEKNKSEKVMKKEIDDLKKTQNLILEKLSS